MKTVQKILAVTILPLAFAASARDPFWPIGFNGGVVEATPRATPVPEVASKPLTQAELEELARNEAELIRKDLKSKGTALMNGKRYYELKGQWVSVGDQISLNVRGNTYRLKITNLTSDNIELEPTRMGGTLQP